MNAELQGTQSVRRIVLRLSSSAETVLSTIAPALSGCPSAGLVSVDVGADLRVVPAFAVDLGPQRDLVIHPRLFHDAAFLNEEL
jgi:hypothetical protein